MQELLTLYLTPISNWVAYQEQLILEKGVPLTEQQKQDATLVGVKNIDQVHLLKVSKVPTPDIPTLQPILQSFGFLSSNTIGVSFRYGIYIQEKYWGQRSIIIHELTHTMQYERLGGIEDFLKQYIIEFTTVGYENSPLELEARQMEKDILRNSGK